MDLIKVFDQAVREIKREVNLKVLKVPEIEQKVLDATSDEPWGPHGSALAEIAQGTKKFSECQMIMNVLWTRLTDTGPNWRHVYKALAVIEYLVANGSERAVDDILEHSFQISSISGFEYVEPNGKDVGINVRKKVETILALLNDKEKVQAVRNKAAANRDKYFGLSSTGITYKSNSSHGSSGFHHNERYGGLSGEKDSDTSKDSSKDTERYGEETERNHVNKGSLNKSLEKVASETERKKSKKKVVRHARDKDSLLSGSSTPSTKAGPVSSSKSSSAQPKGSEDDFDDFDPRGSSSTTGSTATNFNQVDLFGESLVGDLLDAPTSIPTETTTLNSAATPEVDLFADSTFVSASPHVEAATGFQTQANVDLFNNQPSFPAAFTSKEDLFAAPNSSLPAENKSPTSEPTNTNTFDPFAGVPLNNFEGSDLFGAFTSHTDPVTKEPSQNSADNSLNNLDQTSSVASKPAPKKETFQVKSGIWADSLSRGLIDLNITAPKKASLADIGVMGGLGDGSDEKEEGPPTSAYMGRAMGAGSGLGRSGFASSTAIGGNGTFSTLGQPQFGSFK